MCVGPEICIDHMDTQMDICIDHMEIWPDICVDHMDIWLDIWIDHHMNIYVHILIVLLGLWNFGFTLFGRTLHTHTLASLIFWV